MADGLTSAGSGGERPVAARARPRAVGALLALVLAYLGFLLGASAVPDLRLSGAPGVVQATHAGQHLLPREGERSTVVAERPDPRAPVPPPPVARPVGPAAVLILTGARLPGAPARGAPTAVSPLDVGHPPRAPPSVSA